MKYKKVYRDPPFYYDSRRIHFINNSSIYCPVTHFFDNHFNRLHRGLTNISFTGKREHELASNRSFRSGNPDPHGSHRFLRRTASRPGNSGSRNGIIRPDQTAGSFCHLPYHGFTDSPELFQTFRTNSQHPFLHVIGIRHHAPCNSLPWQSSFPSTSVIPQAPVPSRHSLLPCNAGLQEPLSSYRNGHPG